MIKSLRYKLVFMLLLCSLGRAAAQTAMPDTVCIGATRTYQVNSPNTPSTYTWLINGITQASTVNTMTITWNTAGTFQLAVQEHANNGCEGDLRTGTVYVMAPPAAHAGPDIVLCYGQTARLNGSGGEIYQWSPATYLSAANISDPVVAPLNPGTYQYILDVTSTAGCRSVKPDTMLVKMMPRVTVFAGNDTIISLNQPVQLHASATNGSAVTSWSWTPGFGLNNPQVQNPVVSISQETVYTVTGRTAEGCTASDDIRLKVFARSDLYVPTAFTPNGDGLNDLLKVIPAGMKELKYFRVFNRWGDLVFSTTDASRGWDGVFRGIKQNGDVFVWEAAGIDFNGSLLTRKGTVALIR